MWVALIMAVLTYLLQNPSNSSERKKALLTAAAVGGVTYGVTEYTDWGQENLKPLDDNINDFLGFGDGDKKTDADAKDAGEALGGSATGSQKPGSSGSGFWDTLKSWGAAGTATVTGALGLATGALPSWLIWVGVGAGAYLLLKD